MTRTIHPTDLVSVLSAIAMAVLLSGCVATAPLSLISAVDLVLSETEEDAPVQTGPISVDELLAQARVNAKEDGGAVSPTATMERGVSGLDGPAYIALGTFLSALGPVSDRTVIITRAEGDASTPFADAQFAIRVGTLIKQAGHEVRIAVSPVQTPGSLFLALDGEDSA